MNLDGKVLKRKSARSVDTVITALETIRLPKPAQARSTSVFAALRARKTVRSITTKKLSLQQVSNILWAACGINRKSGPFGEPGITAASASNSKEIEVYAAVKEGVYLYDSGAHALMPVAEGDLRFMAIGRGQKSWGADAPLRLIYVVDVDKFSTAGYQEPGLHDPETRKSYYFTDTGIIAGNVYLFAASEGLASWFHNCDKTTVAKQLKLPPNKWALFGQTIGFAGKETAF